VLLEIHLGKAMWWDTLNYEYYTGWAFFHGFGSRFALPGQFQTYLDPQINALYYLLIRHTSPEVEGTTIAALESLSLSLIALLVFRAARKATWTIWQATALGLAAGLVGLLSPTYRSELGSTMSDGLLALPIITAAALLYWPLRSRSATVRLRCALGAGVVLGFTVVIKLTTLAMAVALIVGFGVALAWGRGPQVSTKERVTILGIVGGSSTLVAALIYLPLGATLSQRYQNLFFPYLNSVAQSPLQQPGNFRDPSLVVHGLGNWFHNMVGLVVGTHSLEAGVATQRSPLLIFGAIALLGLLVDDVVRRRSPTSLFLELSALLAFILWSFTVVGYRYVAPLEITMGGLLVFLTLERAGARRLIPSIVAAATIAVAACGGSGANVTREPFGQSFFMFDRSLLSRDAGRHVLMIGGSPMGYLVPSLASGTDVVRVDGNLDQVMSARWWAMVSQHITSSSRSWTVIEVQGGAASSRQSLDRIGVSGSIGGCVSLQAIPIPLEICRLTLG